MLAKIYRFLASIQLTIVLLVVIALAMMTGTAYEATAGTLLAQLDIYHSIWFDFLLGLLAVNLIACTVQRFPYRIGQIGWLMTHTGVLVVLIGAVISREYSIEGTIKLAEGESTRLLNRNSYQLEVQLSDGRSAVLPLRFETIPRSEDGRPKRIDLPFNKGRIELLRYLPSGVGKLTYVSDPTGVPLIDVTLEALGKEVDKQLWCGDGPDGEVMLPNGKKLLFAFVPRDKMDMSYLLEAPADYLLVATESDLSYLAVHAPQPILQPISLGQKLVLDSINTVTVRSLESFAVQMRNFVPAKSGEGEFALKFRIEDPTGGRSNAFWMKKNSELASNHNDVLFRLTSHTDELGFALRLNKVNQKYYPGNKIAAGISSEVTVNEGSASSFAYDIEMNAPLTYHGWKIYQYSVIPGPPKISVFTVSYDPGTTIVYAGCIVLMVGLTVVLFQTRQRKKLEE